MTFMWTLCTTISGTPKRTLHPWGRTECIAPWWRRWHAAPRRATPRRSLLPAATAKGQLILKCFFDIFNSPKKRTKKFNFTAMVHQVELFLFVF